MVSTQVLITSAVCLCRCGAGDLAGRPLGLCAHGTLAVPALAASSWRPASHRHAEGRRDTKEAARGGGPSCPGGTAGSVARCVALACAVAYELGRRRCCCSSAHLGGAAQLLRKALTALKFDSLRTAPCPHPNNPGVHTVVDVGAGKGHLADELATAHGLSVLAVDMSDSLVQQATGQSGRGPQQASAMGNPTGLDGGSGAADPGAAGASGNAAGRGAGGAAAGGRVQVAAVAATLTSENVVQVLQQLLDHQQQQQLAQHGQVQPPQQQRERQQEREPLQSGGLHGPAAGAQRSPRVILVGLHACGDLTPALLRAFLNWPAAAAVVSLGCCYNLLSEAAAPAGGSSGASTTHMPWHRPGAAAGAAGSAAPPPGQDAVPRSCCCCCGACAACAAAGGACHRAAVALAGFPMSQHCQGVSLGWAARTAACHTNERLLAAAAAEGGGGGCQAAERSAAQQAYRAALNRLLQLRCPEVPLSQLSLGRSARVKRKTARPAGTRLALEVQQPQKPPAGAVRNAAAGAVGGAHGPASDCAVPAAACSATEAGFVAYVEEALSKLGLEANVGHDEAAQVGGVLVV